MVGYQDLDANGTWRVNVTFGNVWVPNRVTTGWAPYRDGHWAWIDPWGWTWVDNAPWGFAVSHYGRWMNFGGTWAWVPGPVRARSYYAPALVVFLGGSNFRLRGSGGNVGGIAWFPLGPSDVYRPSYPVSRRYFEDINSSNTVINNTVINNYYNNTNVTNIVYVNRQVPGAVVAVPRTSFEQSQPVSSAMVPVSEQTLASEPVESAPPVAPTEQSVRGAAAKRDRPPPSRVFERPVVARTAPPPAHVGFAAQQPQLEANPGKPLDDNARKQLKRGAAAPAPVVNVIAQAPEVPPSEPPPPPSRAPEQRGQSGQQGQSAPQGKGEQQGKSGQQGKGGQEGEPADVTPATPPRAAQPVEAASPPQRANEPQAVPSTEAMAPAPSVSPAEERGKSAQQGKGEHQGKSGQQGKGAQQGEPADVTPATPPRAAPPVEAASPPQRWTEPHAVPPTKATLRAVSAANGTARQVRATGKVRAAGQASSTRQASAAGQASSTRTTRRPDASDAAGRGCPAAAGRCTGTGRIGTRDDRADTDPGQEEGEEEARGRADA